MSTPQLIFETLTSVGALRDLIGTPETAVLECKTWSDRSDANRGSISKACCGFANAAGGVLIVGVDANGRGPDSPDTIRELKPIDNPNGTLSKINDIIAESIFPGIEGVLARVVSEENPAKGYVILLIPASEGRVHRSKVTKEFYVRVTNGTYPMEYFQIEERFGRSPRPSLQIEIVPQVMTERNNAGSGPGRFLDLWIRNDGRGLARFPGIRIPRHKTLSFSVFGIDGNGGLGLPTSASELESLLLRGGADNVVYPGERYLAARLAQSAVRTEATQPVFVDFGYVLVDVTDTCPELNLECEIYAEGMASKSVVVVVPEDSLKSRQERRTR